MAITKKQKEIIEKMYFDDYIFLVGTSDTTGRPYYLISKGYDNIYFNSRVFGNLLEKELIYQSLSYPFDWLLTKNAIEMCEGKKFKV